MTPQQNLQEFTNLFNYASTSNKVLGVGMEKGKNLIDLLILAKHKQYVLNNSKSSGHRPLLKRLFLKNQIAMFGIIHEVIRKSVLQSSTKNPGKPSFLGPLLAELKSQKSKKLAAVSTSNTVHAEPVTRSSSRRKAAHPQKCIQQEEEEMEIERKSRKRPCSMEDQNCSKRKIIV